MDLCPKSSATLLFAILSWVTTSDGQDLDFVVTNARLPAAMVEHAAVYDGQDSIYMIGGYNGSWQDAVLKYSLDTDTVEVIGTFMGIRFGTAIMHGEDIVYFGGFTTGYTPAVYSYSTRHRNYTQINSLPIGTGDVALTWHPGTEVAYMFGGNNGTSVLDLVLRYDSRTNQIYHVGNLPEPRWAASAVRAPGGIEYIFGGDPGAGGSRRDIMRFDPTTGRATKLATELLRDVFHACAVHADGYAYILTLDALMRFDPATEDTEVVPVPGWPLVYDSACVHVPKLGRIYIIGGFGSYNDVFGYRNEISYLELEIGAK